MPAITLSDLASHDFATVAETACILRIDIRTVRRRCADGTIPGIKAGEWRIPVAWLRDRAHAGIAAS